MNFFDEFLWIRIVIISVGITVAVATRKQKPWWKLTKEEKKKRLPYMVAGIALAAIGVVILLAIHSLLN